jgi:hypothetical protein
MQVDIAVMLFAHETLVNILDKKPSYESLENVS